MRAVFPKTTAYNYVTNLKCRLSGHRGKKINYLRNILLQKGYEDIFVRTCNDKTALTASNLSSSVKKYCTMLFDEKGMKMKKLCYEKKSSELRFVIEERAFYDAKGKEIDSVRTLKKYINNELVQ